MSKNGLILLTPTSIAYTGTSASISANGSVEFSACTTVSLNGVFSADYDNYMIVMRWQQFVTDATTTFRLRNLGVDDSTANSYVRQYLQADSTTVGAGRGTANLTWFTNSGIAQRNGNVAYIYGPYLAQPTAGRTVGADSESNAFLRDIAFTHNQSNSYDGFTWITSNTFTGRIAVYGMRK